MEWFLVVLAVISVAVLVWFVVRAHVRISEKVRVPVEIREPEEGVVVAQEEDVPMLRVTHWYINEMEVLNIIESEGYRVAPTGGTDGIVGWYDTDYPIKFNGKYGLLRSKGTHLTALSDAEIEEKKVQEFNRRLGL